VVKPKRLFRARRTAARPEPKPVIDHGQRFNKAMKLVEVEDFMADPNEPCCLCNSPTSSLAARLTHQASGIVRTEVMHLCPKCRENGGVEKLDRILDAGDR
jgi:hypothetical protein